MDFRLKRTKLCQLSYRPVMNGQQAKRERFGAFPFRLQGNRLCFCCLGGIRTRNLPIRSRSTSFLRHHSMVLMRKQTHSPFCIELTLRGKGQGSNLQPFHHARHDGLLYRRMTTLRHSSMIKKQVTFHKSACCLLLHRSAITQGVNRIRTGVHSLE